jgi:hypothetical protein
MIDARQAAMKPLHSIDAGCAGLLRQFAQEKITRAERVESDCVQGLSTPSHTS